MYGVFDKARGRLIGLFPTEEEAISWAGPDYFRGYLLIVADVIKGSHEENPKVPDASSDLVDNDLVLDIGGVDSGQCCYPFCCE
jgi:hypothetical protein